MLFRYRFPFWMYAQPALEQPLVVFQSDDWCGDCGSLDPAPRWDRAGASARNWCYDGAESADDIDALARVLQSRADGAGRHPVFTLNLILSKPDYRAIRQSAFESYKACPVSGDTPALHAIRLHAAAERPVLEPALHGLEHVNPVRWLQELRRGARALRAHFDAEVMPSPALVAGVPGLGAACADDVVDPALRVDRPAQRLGEAITLFEHLFGRPPGGFVAPNHCWDAEIEAMLAARGVRYIQAAHVHYRSSVDAANGAFESHPMGAKGLLQYQSRTVNFEPVLRQDALVSAVARSVCLLERGIPVVINTHRINYSGAHGVDRRDYALGCLEQLLAALLAAVPALRFVSSNDLYLALDALADAGAAATLGRRRKARIRTLVQDIAIVTLAPRRFHTAMTAL